MVECSDRQPPGGKFSGSTHCGNSHYVLSVAQAQERAETKWRQSERALTVSKREMEAPEH